MNDDETTFENKYGEVWTFKLAQDSQSGSLTCSDPFCEGKIFQIDINKPGLFEECVVSVEEAHFFIRCLYDNFEVELETLQENYIEARLKVIMDYLEEHHGEDLKKLVRSKNPFASLKKFHDETDFTALNILSAMIPEIS